MKNIDSIIKEISCGLVSQNEVGDVVVGLSGGVDSAVVAFILKESGYNVRCLHMVCWKSSDSWCTSDQDLTDSISIASSFGLPIEIVDYTKEYKEKIFDYMITSYKLGLTPSPDVICNREIKFGLGLEYAQKNKSYFATGHYAKIVKKADLSNVGLRNFLKSKIDRLVCSHQNLKKDQSYFLSSIISNEYLNRVIFPLSYMESKEITREIAKYAGIKVSEKPDSQGLCFVGDVSMSKFLPNYIESNVGEVINSKNEVIGEHKGLHLYTVGQRHGFDIYKYTGMPLYVVSKDLNNNRLMVGEKTDCMVREIKVKIRDLVISTENGLNELIRNDELSVRVRSSGEYNKVSNVQMLGEGIYQTLLKRPIFAAAEGQVVAFYCGDAVVASGEITFK